MGGVDRQESKSLEAAPSVHITDSFTLPRGFVLVRLAQPSNRASRAMRLAASWLRPVKRTR